jgi:hypothetical protein
LKNKVKRLLINYIDKITNIDFFEKSIISFNIKNKNNKYDKYVISIISDVNNSYKINIYFDENDKWIFEISKLNISSDVCIWLDEHEFNNLQSFEENLKYCKKYIKTQSKKK